MRVFLFSQHLKHLEMISNDIYTKAVQDVLEFIDTVEDGDLDFIIWKLRKFVEYGEDFNTKDDIE
jgi:predicted nucleotidyltransferase